MDPWEIARNRIVVSLLLAFALLPAFVAGGMALAAASGDPHPSAQALVEVGWYYLRVAFVLGWFFPLIGIVLVVARRVDPALGDFGATLFGVLVVLVGLPLADGIPFLWLLPMAGVVLVITAAPGIARAVRATR